MPLSHCAKSTAVWGRIDNLSLFGWSLLVILATTMTINSYSVLLVRVASAGRYESFGHVQKFRVPSMNTFNSLLCTLKTCSYLLCHTAYVLYSSHSYCIPGCSNCILRHSYMRVRLRQTRRQCKIRWMELECARDCCKVDIRVHIRVNSPLSYTWCVDSYIFLLFSYSISVHSCSFMWNTR